MRINYSVNELLGGRNIFRLKMKYMLSSFIQKYFITSKKFYQNLK